MIPTLPVRPAFLHSTIKDRVCLLSWAATQDPNNSYYDIQRSTDGITFTDLGRIYANATSTTTICYHFRDTQPSAGINNYRLRLVDKNGKVSYSAIVTLSLNDHHLQD